MPYQYLFCPVKFGYRNWFNQHIIKVHEGKELHSQDAYQEIIDVLNNSNSRQHFLEMIYVSRFKKAVGMIDDSQSHQELSDMIYPD